MSSGTTVEKHSVTMPTETSEAVRARVGSRGFSAYVSEAVARQIRRDALDDIVREMEKMHGPADQDEVDEIAARWTEGQ